jgi:hypothetical protein
MYISVHGILIDQAGKVLFYQTGPTTVGIVSCPAEPGILPAEALAQAFRASTGLIVYPVRITGLYHSQEKESSRLSLVYRCIRRGGAVSETESGPVAGFFDPNSLPPGIDAETSRYLEHALGHEGGPPNMESLGPGLWERWGRYFGKQPNLRSGGPDWSATVCLLLDAGGGEVVWRRSKEGDKWQLPSAVVDMNEAPWETAARLGHRFGLSSDATPFNLRMIQIDSGYPSVNLAFSGRLTGQFPRTLDSNKNTLRIPGETGDDFASTDVARVTQTLESLETVIVQLSG